MYVDTYVQIQMLHTGAYVDTDTDIDTDEDANTGADTEAGTDADTGANVGAGVDKDRFFAVFSHAFSSAAGVPCGSLRCLPELCNSEFGNRERAMLTAPLQLLTSSASKPHHGSACSGLAAILLEISIDLDFLPCCCALNDKKKTEGKFKRMP